MTDQLFTDLAQVRALKVISRSSVAVSQQTPRTPQQVANALQVDAVLTGALRRMGDSLRLSVQLISRPDGQALWAASYDLVTRDVPRVHSEAARAMLRHAGIRLTAEERMRLGSPRAVDPEAFALYTKGRYWWNKRDAVALKNAQGFFRKALDSDPTYAAAYAGLADTYNQLGYGLSLPPWEAFPKAKKAASDALQHRTPPAQKDTPPSATPSCTMIGTGLEPTGNSALRLASIRAGPVLTSSTVCSCSRWADSPKPRARCSRRSGWIRCRLRSRVKQVGCLIIADDRLKPPLGWRGPWQWTQRIRCCTSSSVESIRPKRGTRTA